MIYVITAITDLADKLRTDFKPSGSRHIAFLDEVTMEASAGNPLWERRKCHDSFPEPRRNAKIHKIIPHNFIDFREGDISIWIDGNISLNVTPEELAQLWLKGKDIALCEHPERGCLYVEAEVCKTLRLDDPARIDSQMAKYRGNNYPEDNGLCECGLIVRRHTPRIDSLSERWWQEVSRGSSRDQLSFNYVFPKEEISVVRENLRSSELFNYSRHEKTSDQDYLGLYEEKPIKRGILNLDRPRSRLSSIRRFFRKG